MLIGILSDSHERAVTTRRAVNLLLDRGADILLHLGDVGNELVIEELIGHSARLVFGNCDWDVRGLTHYAQSVGIRVDHPMGELVADGKRIAYTHGHVQDLMVHAMRSRVDYLLHGHTHEARDDRIDGVRVINPGALFRANRYTVALLEPAIDKLEFLEVARS